MVRTYLLSFAVILASAALAIAVHAVLPAQVGEDRLDGYLVRRFGFPIVAVSYFVLLYTHCAAVIHVNTRNSRHGGTWSGLLVGLAFALLYLVGMQEIMLDLSAFESWHPGYVTYQFFIGLGDGIPVLILCITIGALVGGERLGNGPASRKTLHTILVFALVIGTTRLVVSYGALIESHVLEYSLPVVAWGFALGCAFGVGQVLLEHAYSRSRAVLVYGLGVNWVLFNLFIGLVKSGALADALTRSLLDVAAMTAAMGLVTRIHNAGKAA